MARILRYLPELDGDEQIHVARLFKNFTDEQAEHFTHVYRQHRKESNITMVTALVGFLGLGGLHRFYLGHIGMGVLYILTAGLCFVGTILDLFRYRSLTFDYNRKKADEVALLVQQVLPPNDDTGTLPPSQ